MKMKKLTEYAEWKALQAHQDEIAPQRLQDWFAKDPSRFSHFSLSVGEILLDYSKNRVQKDTVDLLCQLAKATNLAAKIEALFSGAPINITENRPALHTALRNQTTPIIVNGQDIIPGITNALDKMRQFSEQVRDQSWLGCTGKPIRDIVNIGIGGSHLGPLLTTHALSDFTGELRCYFISNIDTAHINEILAQINPETTLFIVSSKSFTTIETLTNAATIKTWFQTKTNNANMAQHWVAVTAAPEKAIAFGISAEQIFPLWEWVGGRYSIWSAIALPLILCIGMEHFLEFIAGANAMDQHFRKAEFSQNMPVLMGLLGIWYINFFAANHHAIIPYSHHLTHLRSYLQQADMESNGKMISLHGSPVEYATGPIILGEQGCHGQHAFHQSLHQGSHVIPVDFILVGKNVEDPHHDLLVASGLSQAQALMQGKSYEQALAELLAKGTPTEKAAYLAQHQASPGNRPSNTLFLNRITPRNLGALLALYEHKIFVQGAIWEINSFDQWGVELGKQLLTQILADVQNCETSTCQDSSTEGLIRHHKQLKGESM